MIRPSALPRLAQCPVSAVLPQTNHTTAASDKGTAIHAFLADYLKNGDSAYSRVPAKYAKTCYAINVAKLPVGVGTVSTETRVERAGISGTIDVLGLTFDAVVVLDAKTGFTRQSPAREHEQLNWYAVAAAEAHGRRKAIIGIVRIDESGEVWNDIAEVDGFELDAMAGRLDAVILRARNAKPTDTVTTGDHCRFCPAFTACPATREVAALMATDPGKLAEIPLTMEVAADLWRKAKLAEKVVEAVLATLKDFAHQTPILLPNGKRIAAVPVERRSIDAIKAHEVLKDRWGLEVADAAVDYNPSATFTSLKAALQKIAEKGKLASMEREAESLLDAAGAVSRTVHIQVRETK